MFKRKKHIDFSASTFEEAIDCGVECIKWFLIHHFKKTVIILMLLLGGTVYVVMDYVQLQLKHKARIERTTK